MRNDEANKVIIYQYRPKIIQSHIKGRMVKENIQKNQAIDS